MTPVVLSFLFGVIVHVVWPDASERQELTRWMRDRVATISRARDDGRHYDRHPSQTLPRSAHGIGPVCPFGLRACKLHDLEGMPPRDGVARTTPAGLPNVWHDFDTAEKEQ
jgi:hypothetical protein